MAKPSGNIIRKISLCLLIIAVAGTAYYFVIYKQEEPLLAKSKNDDPPLPENPNPEDENDKPPPPEKPDPNLEDGNGKPPPPEKPDPNLEDGNGKPSPPEKPDPNPEDKNDQNLSEPSSDAKSSWWPSWSLWSYLNPLNWFSTVKDANDTNLNDDTSENEQEKPSPSNGDNLTGGPKKGPKDNKNVNPTDPKSSNGKDPDATLSYLQMFGQWIPKRIQTIVRYMWTAKNVQNTPQHGRVAKNVRGLTQYRRPTPKACAIAQYVWAAKNVRGLLTQYRRPTSKAWAFVQYVWAGILQIAWFGFKVFVIGYAILNQCPNTIIPKQEQIVQGLVGLLSLYYMYRNYSVPSLEREDHPSNYALPLFMQEDPMLFSGFCVLALNLPVVKQTKIFSKADFFLPWVTLAVGLLYRNSKPSVRDIPSPILEIDWGPNLRSELFGDSPKTQQNEQQKSLDYLREKYKNLQPKKRSFLSKLLALAEALFHYFTDDTPESPTPTIFWGPNVLRKLKLDKPSGLFGHIDLFDDLR